IMAGTPTKWSSSNVGLACTHAMIGYGYGVAIACGKDTEVGKMAMLSIPKRPKSRIVGFLRQFHAYIIVVITIMIIILLFMMGIHHNVMITIQMSLCTLMALVPIYLPMFLWLCLWVGKQQMINRRCLVRNLKAASTVGLTTVIVTDCSETLTRRPRRVSEVFANQSLLYADYPNHMESPGESFAELIRASVLCNDAVFAPGQIGMPPMKKIIYGNTIDVALFKFALQFIPNIVRLRRDNEMVANKAYNDLEHMQVTVHSTTDENDEPKLIMLMKGHWDVVLRRCSTMVVDGDDIPVDDDMIDTISNMCENLLEEGRHVRAFAYKEIDEDVEVRRFSLLYKGSRASDTKHSDYLALDTFGLRLLGVIALHDPPRSNIRNAVARCRSAGIKIVVTTRQKPNRAKALALDVDILTLPLPNDPINQRTLRFNASTEVVDMAMFDGQQLDSVRWEIRQLLLGQRDLVCANCTAEEQYMIVDVCIELGAVVSAIGGTLHHTPLLQRAHVGASKYGATATCEGGADIILENSSFATLVSGIELSRLLFENMKKAMAYCLATNTTFFLAYLGFFFVRLPIWFHPVPVLFVQFLVNMLPGVTLITELAEKRLMQQMPRVYDNNLFNSRLMFVSQILVGTIEAGAVFIVYFKQMSDMGFVPRTLCGLNYKWYDEREDFIYDTYGQEWSFASRQMLDCEVSTSMLVVLILMQTVNLMLTKTGRSNILRHGCQNWILNIALVYLLCLCAVLGHVDFPVCLRLSKVRKYGVFMSLLWTTVPFAFLLVIVETSRRYFLRTYPGSWIEKWTYY
ncbi:hypothetical protein KR018_004751, partial [Drosophila ironensis]